MRFLGSLLLLLTLPPTLTAQPKESDYYTIMPIEPPPGVVFEVGGLTLTPERKLLACTRRGEVWQLDHVFADSKAKPRFTLFAQGLHEALGITAHQGWFYVVQKPELTRLKDTDGDGRADVFETVSDGWGFSGDGHEYAFSAGPDKAGNWYVVLCLTGSGSYRADFRGWIMQVRPDGKTVPFAHGIRSPGGIGFDLLGNLLYLDVQGQWVASSSLRVVPPGSFHGNPSSQQAFALGKLGPLAGSKPPPPNVPSRIDTERQRVPQLVPPAVIFPHGSMGNNPTGFVADHTRGQFGPFAGQIFVAEHTASRLHRVFLEKVNGVSQGAAFFFLTEGFSSGNIAPLLSEDGTFFIGGSARGWGAKGGREYSLERINWTGKVPFEIHEMRAQSSGFELTFTLPVDAQTASKPSSYSIAAYTYPYNNVYGGPQVDLVKPKITRAVVSKDRKAVQLTIEPLTKGHVHELHLKGVRSEQQQSLLHPSAYYTLNEIPGR